MIHRRVAAFGSEAQARREIAEKTKRNGMCDLRKVRELLFCGFT